eukprot:1050667-Rhodomonas_salina.1
MPSPVCTTEAHTLHALSAVTQTHSHTDRDPQGQTDTDTDTQTHRHTDTQSHTQEWRGRERVHTQPSLHDRGTHPPRTLRPRSWRGGGKKRERERERGGGGRKGGPRG